MHNAIERNIHYIIKFYEVKPFKHITIFEYQNLWMFDFDTQIFTTVLFRRVGRFTCSLEPPSWSNAGSKCLASSSAAVPSATGTAAFT